ncbi:GntR family transcriptional regulator, partial [Streptomyces hundungensis]
MDNKDTTSARLRRVIARGAVATTALAAVVGVAAPGVAVAAPGDAAVAMQQLSIEGAVEVVPNRGFRVTERSARELA